MTKTYWEWYWMPKTWGWENSVRFNSGNPYRSIHVGPVFIRIFL